MVKFHSASFAAFLMIAATGALTTGCGKNGAQLVKDVRLTSFERDDGAYVEVRALVETLNLDFGGQVPIFDPRRPGVSYGWVGLSPSVTESGSDLFLAVNLTLAQQGTSVDGRFLPNGAFIPVSTGSVPVFGLRAGSNSLVYVALGEGVAMLGTAVTLREFDSIGKTLPGLNLFPGFDLGNGIRGLAGIFTGMQPMQSGLAFFVDASSALPKKPEVSAVERSPLAFHEHRAKSGDELRAVSELYRVGNRRKKLWLR